ncbi:MAG: glycosyltransferase family 39 protein [Bacteroidetes bacterium]|nr:glycosyltransferase family 39 protein [Bacteroidota bacterium]
MINKRAQFFILTGTILLSFLMHFHVFTVDLVGYHVWRQTQTQNNIESFYKEDFNILHPKTNDRGNGSGIQRLEFPVMQWLFACFYKLFGDHLIISRILSFIIGIFSMIGIYFLLKNIFHNSVIGLIGAWTFTFSPVFYYYTMNPLPDNFALCCSIWGLAFFFQWISQKIFLQLFISGCLLSLGILAKLPFILFLSVPVIYFFLETKSNRKYYLRFLFLFLLLIPPFIWYAKAIAPHWSPVVYGIFDEHNLSMIRILDILQFNLISTLPELLINYGSVFFFLYGFYYIYKKEVYKNIRFKIFLAFAVVLLLYFLYEMHIIAKIHDYYLFPFLPLIFITVSYGCFHLLNSQKKLLVRFGFFLLLILPVTAYVRADTRWDIQDPGFNSDLLVYKNELRNAVPDTALCIVGNDESKNIFLYYVNKRGWAFENNDLDSIKIKTMIDKGAEYLYCDSREVDEKKEIKSFLDSLIIQKGTVKIYTLKKK